MKMAGNSYQMRLKRTLPTQTNFAVEKVDFSLFAAEQLQKHFPGIRFTVDLTPVVQQLRLVKDADAIESLSTRNLCR